MPQVNTGSDLIEVLLTPAEKHTAMQLSNRDLSVMYLTNTRIGILRILAEQEFTDPAKDIENQRIRAYHKGQYDLLSKLIEGAMNPDPIPLESEQSQPQSSQNFGA